MRIPNEPIPAVVSSGVKSQKTFTLKPSREAFRLLSSGLYSDPILAIVRELSCNALDSHVLNGSRECPFDIELPSRMRPFFRIRDYGVSLSHDEVMNLYSTYFESNKTEDNTQVGALGLGSKSPLGYTQSFSVNAYKDGVMRSYSVFIGDDESDAPGFPNIAFNGESQNSASPGIEIIIPVPAEDFHKWPEACRKVFPWFPVKPTFIGDDIQIVKPVVERQIGNVCVTSFENRTTNKWHVLQGTVSYPLNIELLDNKYEFLSELAGYIVVNIGEVVFSPNRETLTYNKQTITCLERNLEEFIAGMAKDLLADLESKEKYDDVFDAAYTIMQTFLKKDATVKNTIREKLNKSVEWFNKGKEESHSEYRPWQEHFTGYYISKLKFPARFITTAINNVLANSEIKNDGWYYLGRNTRSFPQFTLKTFSSHNTSYPDVHVFYNDTGKSVVGRFKNYLRRGQWGLADGERLELHSSLILFINEDQDISALEQFLNLRFSSIKLWRVSELDMPEQIKVRKTAAEKKARYCVILGHNYPDSPEPTWSGGHDLEELVADDQKTYIWVKVRGMSPLDYDGNIKEFLHGLPEEFGVREIIGIKDADEELVRKKKNWIRADNFIDQFVKPKMSKDEISLSFDSYHYHQTIEDMEKIVRSLVLNSSLCGLIECPDFAAIVEQGKKYAMKNSMAGKIVVLLQWLKENNVEFELPENTLAKYVESVYNKTIGLPLILEGLSYHPDVPELKVFIKYINHFAKLQGVSNDN